VLFRSAASGIASAAAILTLLGHDDDALNDIAMAAAGTETVIGALIESRRTAPTSPLREGASGLVVRIGGVLSGPVPLIIRAASDKPAWRKVASVAALAGSLLTRLGWIAAGRASAKQKHRSS